MKKRIGWVDYAKGISMLLVILHHSIMRSPESVFYSDSLVTLNDTLKFFRMPLFFFLSGIFIYKSLNVDVKSFFDKRIKNIMFVYIVWNVLWYLTIIIFVHSLFGQKVDFSWISSLFYNPPIYWFLYALIIFSTITYLFRKNIWVLFTLSLIGFAISISNGNHHDPSFMDELLRYIPMYLLGYYFSKNILKYSEYIKKWYVIGMPAYLYIVSAVLDSSLKESFVVVFTLMLIGIILGISLSKILTDIKYFHFIEYIGRNTLPFYILHTYPKFFVTPLFNKIGMDSVAVYTITQIILSLLFPFVALKVINNTPLKILFNINLYKKDMNIKNEKVVI